MGLQVVKLVVHTKWVFHDITVTCSGMEYNEDNLHQLHTMDSSFDSSHFKIN